MVVDGLVLCNTACLTCLWCALLSMCFPKYMRKLEEADSSACCAQKSASGTKLSEMLDQCKSKVKLMARRSTSVCQSSRSQLREMSKSATKNRAKHKYSRCDGRKMERERDVKDCLNKPKITVCVSDENEYRTARRDDNDEYDLHEGTAARRHSTRSPANEKNRKYKLYAKLCRQPSGYDEQFVGKSCRSSGSERLDYQQQCEETSMEIPPSSNLDCQQQCSIHGKEDDQ